MKKIEVPKNLSAAFKPGPGYEKIFTPYRGKTIFSFDAKAWERIFGKKGQEKAIDK